MFLLYILAFSSSGLINSSLPWALKTLGANKGIKIGAQIAHSEVSYYIEDI